VWTSSTNISSKFVGFGDLFFWRRPGAGVIRCVDEQSFPQVGKSDDIIMFTVSEPNAIIGQAAGRSGTEHTYHRGRCEVGANSHYLGALRHVTSYGSQPNFAVMLERLKISHFMNRPRETSETSKKK
jgi:hypothetical protein